MKFNGVDFRRKTLEKNSKCATKNPEECSVLCLPWVESEYEARALRINVGG